MTCGVLFSPDIYFVVPVDTYLTYDEDVLECCFMLILIGIDWVFIIYYQFLFLSLYSFLCLKFI